MNDLQPLIIESAQLMLIGMGSVFIILTLLIFLITFVSKLLARFYLEEAPLHHKTSFAPAQKSTITLQDDNQLIAIISSAIASYKKRHTEKTS